MSASRFKDALAAQRPRGARIGTITAVSLVDSTCTVLLAGGEAVASLTDQVLNFVEVGAVVTLLPLGDSLQVIATQGSSAGSGGPILGPEFVPNGQFEYGSTGAAPDLWKEFPSGDAYMVWDGTIGQAVSGNGRALVTLPGGVDPIDHFTAQTAAMAVDDDVDYNVSVWLKASTLAASLVLRLQVMSAPTEAGVTPFGVGAVLTTIASVTSPGAVYQLATGTWNVPTGHNFARLFLNTECAAGVALTASWDDASLRQRITS